MGVGQGPNIAGYGGWSGVPGSSGVAALGGNSVANNTVWYTTVDYAGNPLSPPTVSSCRKHRIAVLELVGDQIEGICAGCGERSILPDISSAGKMLVRVMTFQDRVSAIKALPAADARRLTKGELVNDFMELCDVVDLAEGDLAAASRALDLVRAQMARLLAIE